MKKEQALREALKEALAPQEELLWSDHPRLLFSRKAFLFDTLITISLTILVPLAVGFFFFHLTSSVIFSPKFLPILPLILLLLIIGTLRQYLKIRNTFFFGAPSHHQHALYAITNQRALILLHCYDKLVTLAYLPSDLTQPTSKTLKYGGSTLTFGPDRQLKPIASGPTLTIPACFYSIAHPQEAQALLEQL